MQKLIFSIAVFYCAFQCIGVAQTFPSGYQAQILVDSLNPVDMVVDHHENVWLVEKNGKVLIYHPEEGLKPDPFINLEVDDFNERGLLGIAIHPQVDIKPYVYLYYTVPNAGHNRVSRFKLNGDLAIPGSEEILLNLDALSGNIHNGGAMTFDNQGYLYIATGEGGFAQSSQNFNSLLGKILRIHDDGSIPEDNPFYSTLSGKYRSIWSLGLRNPFSMSYDSKEDILYATDVGAGNFEEINIITKSGNYGWPIIEGPLNEQEEPENYIDPFFYYSHEEGCAIVGLSIVNSSEVVLDTLLEGGLLFADYCDGYIKYIKNGAATEVIPFVSEIERPLKIIFDSKTSSIYYQTRIGLGGGTVSDNSSTSEGQLWKLNYVGSGNPKIISGPKNISIPQGENATFSVLATGEDTIHYRWFINETPMDNDTSILILESVALDQNGSEIYVIVENYLGSDTSTSIILEVLDNNRPTAIITTPKEASFYKAGDTIYFSGFLEDAEEGIIDSSNYSWHADFHHGSHTHPLFSDIDSIAQGYTIIPTTGETDTNVWIRIYLSGSDSSHLFTSNYVEIFPALGQISLLSDFDAFVNIDGAIRKLPYTYSSTLNLASTIEVPIQNIQEDKILLFNSWEDGYDQNIRTIAATEEDSHYKLLFDTIQLGKGKGLYAEYWNDPEKDLDGIPTMTRIDSTINFKWNLNSPDEDKINSDHFTARWRGYIEPLFTDDHILTVGSDDGFRLWIDHELRMDHWQSHAFEEYQDTLPLTAHKRHHMRLEYFEDTGNASVSFAWSSSLNKKEIIPKRQLHPMTFGSIHGRVWHDSNRDSLIQEDTEEYLESIDIFLFDTLNKFVDHTTSNEDGFFSFRDYEVGSYYMYIKSNDASFIPGYGLDQNSFSKPFTLKSNLLLEERYGFMDIVSGNQEVGFENNRVDVFPNPLQSKEKLTIKGPIISLDIYDFLGKKVNYDLISDLNSTNCQVKLQTTLTGMYKLIIKTKDKTVTHKLIVIR